MLQALDLKFEDSFALIEAGMKRKAFIEDIHTLRSEIVEIKKNSRDGGIDTDQQQNLQRQINNLSEILMGKKSKNSKTRSKSPAASKCSINGKKQRNSQKRSREGSRLSNNSDFGIVDIRTETPTRTRKFHQT